MIANCIIYIFTITGEYRYYAFTYSKSSSKTLYYLYTMYLKVTLNYRVTENICTIQQMPRSNRAYPNIDIPIQFIQLTQNSWTLWCDHVTS